MSWCTIESDPGVFTELISEIGVKGVQVDELYDMEPESMSSMKPYGLIFLFKWQNDDKDTRPVIHDAPGVFFAKQEITNACATQAIISVLMNRPELDLGTTMGEFKSFTMDLPSDMRGLAIGNSDTIRTAHNSFARPEPFVTESKTATGDDDVYHFIGYVPVNGKVYELDGLKAGPVCLGECDMDKWCEVAAPAIQQRVQRYSAKEIGFNLLALRQAPKDAMAKALALLAAKEAQVKAKLGGKAVMEDDGSALPSDKGALEALQASIAAEKADLEAQLRAEDEKYEAWKVENVRRKHNYIPFVYNLLKLLAKNGKTESLVEEAVKAAKAKKEAAAAKKDAQK